MVLPRRLNKPKYLKDVGKGEPLSATDENVKLVCMPHLEEYVEMLEKRKTDYRVTQ